VASLTYRIERSPRTLADIFLRMYQEQLAALPPNDPRVDELLQKIEQLTEFRQTIPQ